MEEEKKRAVVEIFGEEYIMRGDASPEYMKKLAINVDKKMKEISSKFPQLSVRKVAVLAALNIADELTKLQEEYDTLIQLLDEEKKE